MTCSASTLARSGAGSSGSRSTPVSGLVRPVKSAPSWPDCARRTPSCVRPTTSSRRRPRFARRRSSTANVPDRRLHRRPQRRLRGRADRSGAHGARNPDRPSTHHAHAGRRVSHATGTMPGTVVGEQGRRRDREAARRGPPGRDGHRRGSGRPADGRRRYRRGDHPFGGRRGPSSRPLQPPMEDQPATRSGEQSVADFTDVWNLARFVSVRFATEAFSQRILGWRISASKAIPLVPSTSDLALLTRQRADVRFTSTGLASPSDAGGPYNTSSAFNESWSMPAAWAASVTTWTTRRWNRPSARTRPRASARSPARGRARATSVKAPPSGSNCARRPACTTPLTSPARRTRSHAPRPPAFSAREVAGQQALADQGRCSQDVQSPPARTSNWPSRRPPSGRAPIRNGRRSLSGAATSEPVHGRPTGTPPPSSRRRPRGTSPG